MRQISLKPPQDIKKPKARKIGGRPVNLSEEATNKLEQELKKEINAWKTGTSRLRARLRDLNDHYEGVSEEVSFPWTGASNVTMGVAAGMARTLKATFDRAVFPDQRPFLGKSKGNVDREQRNKLETAVNWLAMEHNNLVDTMRDTPVPIFRDGTAPIMGEWKRRIEKASDYRTYTDTPEFLKDYPDPKTSGVSEERYSSILEELSKVNAEIVVEFVYDEVVYDAPHFSLIPLAQFAHYPMSANSIHDMTFYGRQYFETMAKAEEKAERGVYDKDKLKEIEGSKMAGSDDAWGYSREQIEGISSLGDETKRLELYRLVICRDLDGDKIPEKYMVYFALSSGKILKITRYGLRKNIDCVVPVRFLRRDGRFLAVSLLDDGFDQFKMVDSMHRHRQNVRAITDSPCFIVPNSLKDDIDFGSEDSVWRPGLTFWLPDKYTKEGAGPRQLQVQSFSRGNESMDEEPGVIRYLEFRLGPSMGLSGQESVSDPRAPASKHLAQMKQGQLRLDDYIREFKRAVPDLIDLMLALYYQYGPDKVSYMEDDESPEADGIEKKHAEAERTLFALSGLGFTLKHQEVSLSPELEMEKALALAGIAAQSPILLQMKPEILLHLWNDIVLASRTPGSERLRVPLPKPGSPGTQTLKDGNRFDEENPGQPTPNQKSAMGMASFAGALNGSQSA